MSTNVPQEIFGKGSKYKLKFRTQEVSANQEYRDVDLDDKTYKKASISRFLTDDDDEAKTAVRKRFRV